MSTLRGHSGPLTVARFSPEGDRVLTASYDRTARLWSLDAKPVAVLKGHEDWVHLALFSPQGDQVLTASADDTARIWDLTGKEVAVVKCARGRTGDLVRSAVFSPEGDRVLTASGRTARLWWWRRDDLLRIANAWRVRDFTPEERQRYRDLLGD